MSVLSLKSETIDKQQLCAVSSNNNSTVRIVTVRIYNCSYVYLDYDKSVVTANTAAATFVSHNVQFRSV